MQNINISNFTIIGGRIIDGKPFTEQQAQSKVPVQEIGPRQVCFICVHKDGTPYTIEARTAAEAEQEFFKTYKSYPSCINDGIGNGFFVNEGTSKYQKEPEAPKHSELKNEIVYTNGIRLKNHPGLYYRLVTNHNNTKIVKPNIRYLVYYILSTVGENRLSETQIHEIAEKIWPGIIDYYSCILIQKYLCCSNYVSYNYKLGGYFLLPSGYSYLAFHNRKKNNRRVARNLAKQNTKGYN
jgi:hypothetical protein